MAKKNTFYGVIMSFSTVNIYYPINSNYPLFDRFVFQQMIEDGSKANDDYTLTVFAVNSDGTVLNGGNPLALLPSGATGVAAKKNVQFANMKLDTIGLAILFPGGLNSDLNVYPQKFYKSTGYVVYTAETDQGPQPFTKINYALNPSPPA